MRTKATKSGLTHRRPSRYARSKSALRRRTRGRERPDADRLSVKRRGGGVPCAGAAPAPLGPPSIASSRESRGCGCGVVDSAGRFSSFRKDSRFSTVRVDLTVPFARGRSPSKRNPPCYPSSPSLSIRSIRSPPVLLTCTFADPREFFLVAPHTIC
jgi:hypothetical protein